MQLIISATGIQIQMTSLDATCVFSYLCTTLTFLRWRALCSTSLWRITPIFATAFLCFHGAPERKSKAREEAGIPRTSPLSAWRTLLRQQAKTGLTSRLQAFALPKPVRGWRERFVLGGTTVCALSEFTSLAPASPPLPFSCLGLPLFLVSSWIIVFKILLSRNFYVFVPSSFSPSLLKLSSQFFLQIRHSWKVNAGGTNANLSNRLIYRWKDL